MSSKERRAEKAREWEHEQIRQEAERRRKAALCMYDRIEESDASESVKEILHMLAGPAEYDTP